MGFGFLNVSNTQAKKTAAQKVGPYSIDLLHRSGCQVCPLNIQRGLRHPRMDAAGSTKPSVYFLGSAPNDLADQWGRHFHGELGNLIKQHIPEEFAGKVRWNYCVRTRLKKNQEEPGRMEIECCRKSVEADIVATKPRLIIGLGKTPLQWAAGQSRLTLWRGRMLPIIIGGHACWFFSTYDPQWLLNSRKFQPRPGSYGSDIEFAFAVDLMRAFDWVKDLPPPVIHTPEQVLEGIEIITDLGELEDCFAELSEQKTAGFDYETNGLRPYAKGAKLLSAGFSSKVRTFAYPIRHSQSRWSRQQLDRVLTLTNDFLYKSPCRKIAHHAAFEMEWSAFFFGRECLRAQPWEDTESQGYILDSRRGALSLEDLCQQYFGIDLKGVTGDLNRKNLDAEPLDKVLLYNGADAKYHRLLYYQQYAQLRAENMLEVYAHQMRRIPTLVLTQMQGIPIDGEVTERLRKKYQGRLDKIEQKIRLQPEAIKFAKAKGYQYKPSTPQHVSFLCRNILKATIGSTDEKTISQINHPLIRMTLRWRKTAKLLSTYVKPMLPDSPVMFPGSVLHPIISTTTTTTWRTSCEDPNVQNWPKHEKAAIEVRGQFKARRGFRVVSFDYSGIQARNIAMESRDKKLIDSYWHGYDIHADWRNRIQRIYPKWIPGGMKAITADPKLGKEYRQKAKNGFVFASFFGAQPYTLARALGNGITEPDCERLLEEFFHEFPGVKAWHERLKKNYYQYGYITGLSGFRRYAPVSSNERINTPIQGDESIIVCDAMARLSEMEDPEMQSNLEVHDDLVFVFPESHIIENSKVVISTMLDVPFEWAKVVPIGVEMSIGNNWGQMMDVAAFQSNHWGTGEHARLAERVKEVLRALDD